jgi:selenide,water dikinase
MGGRPISALSIVGFPEKGDPAILEQIMRGGLSKMAEAKCSVIGGHSLRNEDIQFGYAVTGLIDPKRVWRNVGAQTNDVLLFTKPLGTGVISTAQKRDRAHKESVDAATAAMIQLNDVASQALRALESEAGQGAIHAVTDVTGFSLLGHAREMALGDPSNGIQSTSFEIRHDAFRLLPGALDAIRQGMIPGGLNNNRDFIGDCVGFADDVPEEYRAILFDPQTSGGLLMAISPEAEQAALDCFERHNVKATRVGRVLKKSSPLLHVI